MNLFDRQHSRRVCICICGAFHLLLYRYFFGFWSFKRERQSYERAPVFRRIPPPPAIILWRLSTWEKWRIRGGSEWSSRSGVTSRGDRLAWYVVLRREGRWCDPFRMRVGLSSVPSLPTQDQPVLCRVRTWNSFALITRISKYIPIYYEIFRSMSVIKKIWKNARARDFKWSSRHSTLLKYSPCKIRK